MAVFRKIARYFLQGLLLTLPLILTGYALVRLLKFLDEIIPIDIPGLGILIILVGFTFMGFIGNTIIIQWILGLFARIIQRAPLLKTLYDAVRDLVSAFVGKKKSFTQPVLVQISTDGALEKMGFITQEDLSELGIAGKVAVYLPHSYAFSGNMFIVDKNRVKPIDAKAGDVMKFIVSGGVSHDSK